MIALEFLNSGTFAIISTFSFVSVMFCTGDKTSMCELHGFTPPLITVIGCRHNLLSSGSLESIISI